MCFLKAHKTEKSTIVRKMKKDTITKCVAISVLFGGLSKENNINHQYFNDIFLYYFLI